MRWRASCSVTHACCWRLRFWFLAGFSFVYMLKKYSCNVWVEAPFPHHSDTVGLDCILSAAAALVYCPTFGPGPQKLTVPPQRKSPGHFLCGESLWFFSYFFLLSLHPLSGTPVPSGLHEPLMLHSKEVSEVVLLQIQLPLLTEGHWVAEDLFGLFISLFKFTVSQTSCQQRFSQTLFMLPAITSLQAKSLFFMALWLLCCCCWVTSVMSDSVWPHRQQPTSSPVPGILQARTLEWVAISFYSPYRIVAALFLFHHSPLLPDEKCDVNNISWKSI